MQSKIATEKNNKPLKIPTIESYENAATEKTPRAHVKSKGKSATVEIKSLVLNRSPLTNLQTNNPINDKHQESIPNPMINAEKIYAAGTPAVSLGSFGFSNAPATEYTYKRNADSDRKQRKKYHFHELIPIQLHMNQSSEMTTNIRSVF
ncbi:hypothetical protein EXW72_08355 [Pseudomonas sp. BCA14]|uniref:hypothetical protein n=1 Tax=unclassified Pseudomonas TaxID=196821 RepID=UPI00106EB23E|nr:MULTISPECIES: hypothetical protein [unclassified Pseudomonas]TFF13720.1 hypothetical protein EXW70_04135 [Pseudomonas sp. JMN1]TFF15597.1 hypothetical protein EXW71_04905 [Pseudomonas sp. BCA17]TFF32004.1 hypothetical protein EXW72_08355 [Pseudomonas sp. BCA14]TFF32957.1 hypothetical protein EXW73_04155 [Pseudomonas sp. BCA13]